MEESGGTAVKRKEYLYMIVTQDEYELPLAVAESVAEIASIAEVSDSAVRSTISNTERGLYKHARPKFRRVPNES